MAFFLPQLIERLSHPSAGVRRIAVLDLRERPLTSEQSLAVADALAGAILAEPDDPTRIALIRALAPIGSPQHQPPLAALRDDPATPVAVAHAATLAHDAILARSGSPPNA